MESKLSDGYVEARVTPPPRPVEKILLRAPLPDGWHVESAQIDSEKVVLIDGNIVDLTGRNEPVTVRFSVSKNAF
jgi:hypothetical protein